MSTAENDLHLWGEPDESEFAAMERALSPTITAEELERHRAVLPHWHIQLRNTEIVFLRTLNDINLPFLLSRPGTESPHYSQLFDPEHFDPELERIFGGKGVGSREARILRVQVRCNKMAITEYDVAALYAAEQYLIASGVVPEPTPPQLSLVDQDT